MAVSNTHTIVDRVTHCRHVVLDLLTDDVISADAEGVHLGRDGPLTLLQVGRTNGHVYLFDIQSGGKDMFTDGRLQELLESHNVLKVMHGSSNDSLALNTQFNVKLFRVFDTQIAHMTRDKHQGRQLPSRMKLSELCSTYLDDVSVLDKKDDIQVKWDKTEGEYWAKRPMTEEMIDYACSDVRLLLPVYRKQISILQGSGLWELFQGDVEVEIRCRWDDSIKTDENEKKDAIIHKITTSMERKYHDSPNIEVINDEDEIQALKRIRIQEIDKFPQIIRTLKYQLVKNEVLEIRDDIQEQQSDFTPRSSNIALLLSVRNHPEEPVKILAKELINKCYDIIQHDMGVKYSLTTPLKHTTANEQRMLRGLRPKSDTDKDYHPVVLKLYWKLMERDLQQEIENFGNNPADYPVREGYIKKVKFYLSGQGVPSQIKTKAKGFVSDLQSAGKIARFGRDRARGRRY